MFHHRYDPRIWAAAWPHLRLSPSLAIYFRRYRSLSFPLGRNKKLYRQHFCLNSLSGMIEDYGQARQVALKTTPFSLFSWTEGKRKKTGWNPSKHYKISENDHEQAY